LSPENGKSIICSTTKYHQEKATSLPNTNKQAINILSGSKHNSPGGQLACQCGSALAIPGGVETQHACALAQSIRQGIAGVHRGLQLHV
jgi:hypothetical protein